MRCFTKLKNKTPKLETSSVSGLQIEVYTKQKIRNRNYDHNFNNKCKNKNSQDVTILDGLETLTLNEGHSHKLS